MTAPNPLRLLVVLPSWVGDAVMATPALARIRRALPGAFIGALARPGIDQMLAGLSCIDEFHVERASGVMGPKFVAAKLRPRRYDTALLLTNSFSTALIARIAGIPRRIGYDRDARGLLLTQTIKPAKKGLFQYDIIPACTYYWKAVDALLGASSSIPDPLRAPLPPGAFMELATSAADDAGARSVLYGAAITSEYAVLNPGGNNPAKRWPVERFAQLADALWQSRGLHVIVNGAPSERELCTQLAEACRVARPLVLPNADPEGKGVGLGVVKALVRGAQLMVTNDTGPRHIAAAFGVPLVTLFGPTDHRWTVIPTRPAGPEMVVLADPTLEAHESANDHPQRCRVDRITLERVVEAVEQVFAARSALGKAGA